MSGTDLVWFWTVLVFIVVHNCDSQTQIGQTCTTPNQEIAKCLSIFSCDTLKQVITSKDPDVVRFLKNSHCGWKNANNPLVCCGTETSYTDKSKISSTKLLPDLCGYQLDFGKILGGENTDLEEFPWVALLKYIDNTGQVFFHCGGILISKRYVLTAGHCIELFKHENLVSVRFGEWNLSSTIDCVGKQHDSRCVKAIDIEIESVKLHENYKSGKTELLNDIALIRLKNDVKFADNIQPICLPENSLEESRPGDRLWVAGWGFTNVRRKLKSTIKQKVQLPKISMDSCRRKYDMYGIAINESHLCAGGQIGKDSCNGDSGGPLMVNREKNMAQFYVEGIVSFSLACGTSIPGVYTRVSAYLDWIKQNIKE